MTSLGAWSVRYINAKKTIVPSSNKNTVMLTSKDFTGALDCLFIGQPGKARSSEAIIAADFCNFTTL